MQEKEDLGSTRLRAIKRGAQEVGIFELANLFGITSEALRKYESKQILQPHRDEKGYRKYRSWELTKIIRARQLRSEGFSLNSIAEDMRCSTSMGQVETMEEMQQELMREIAHRKKLIHWLGAQKDEIIRAEHLGDKCVIERQPKLYCCVYMVDNTLVDKEGKHREQLKAWIRALPFVSVYYVGGFADEMLSCLVISEEERKRYELEDLVPDFVMPEQLCAVCNCVAEHSQTHDTSAECIAEMRRRGEQLGVGLTDQIALRMIRYVQKGGIYQSYNKAFIPIAQGE